MTEYQSNNQNNQYANNNQSSQSSPYIGYQEKLNSKLLRYVCRGTCRTNFGCSCGKG